MKLKFTGGKLHKREEYRKLGFRCGLEVHQQLDTKKKLFCNCPVGMVYSKPDARILRHMRPTLSELGEYDGTALMEFKTKKEVIYHLYRDNTCTYEMDDTPPFPVNQDAVDIAIEIALLFNCSIVDEVHIVRKQYLDGSIPTGFQRTAVIGLNGWIPYKNRKIRISMITLEEDACREVSDEGHIMTFSTDRLSTPLVEVITCPDIESPMEVPEVNWLLAETLRSSGKVRRGFGSVRQDVNVSIDGGTRVEIKGVPKIGYNAALTHNEALRQKKLLEMQGLLKKRGLKAREDYKFTDHDATDIVDWQSLIPNSDENSCMVKALTVKGINGVLNTKLQPGWIFADELAGRVRVIACLDRMPNIIHSSAVKGNFVPVEVWADLRDSFNVDDDTEIILTWGKERDVETAINEMKDRLAEMLGGVPNETRQSLDNGVTDFERILPGPDRMYPDTDSAPTTITKKRVEEIRRNLPVSPFKVRELCDKNGLAGDLTDYVLRSGKGPLYYELINELKVDPKEAAIFLRDKVTDLRRNGLNVAKDDFVWIKDYFDSIKENGGYGADFRFDIIAKYLEGDVESIEAGIAECLKDKVEPKKIRTELTKIIKSDDAIKKLSKQEKTNYAFGELRKQVEGYIKPADVLSALKELL